MKTNRATWTALALIAIAGCYGMRIEGCYPSSPVTDSQTDILPGPAGAAAYFPLDVGNTWTYGHMDPDPNVREAALTWTVVGKTVDGASLEIGYVGTETLDTIGYKASWDAVVAVESLGPSGAGAIIELPLIAGNQWDAECVSRKIVATDSVQSTPASDFSDVLVVRTSPAGGPGCPQYLVGWYEMHYYARDVGLVKWEYYILAGTGSEPSSTHELVEYTVE